MRRVVITGCGTINPLGKNVLETWDSFAVGKDGITELDMPDLGRLASRVGGQVRSSSSPYQGENSKVPLNVDRVTSFVSSAASEAINCSGINFDSSTRESSAVILGTAGGGLNTQDESYRRIYQEKKNRVHPLTVPKLMHSAPASQISIEHNISGPVLTFSTACASSNHAIGQAYSMIKSGQILAAISGGAESMLCFGGLKAWEGLRLTAREKCRPFCATRDGMIQGEGATVFVLEELEHAIKRRAEIYAEICGYSMTSDASEFMNPSVEGVFRAMKLALNDAMFNPEDVGYINAHGTGTAINDKIESVAINKLFGLGKNSSYVSSTKSMHGHLIGGSGALELLSCILALKKGILAPTINHIRHDPLCDINLVTNHAIQFKVSKVLSNSFAFGGLNAVLALKSF